MKVAHKERCPFNVCGKDFGSRQGLAAHMNMHMGLTPFQCDKCDSAFVSLDCLCKHKRFHCKGGVMGAPCPVCGKELPTKGALEMHMKNNAKEKRISL